jgi:hypothetical protein
MRRTPSTDRWMASTTVSDDGGATKLAIATPLTCTGFDATVIVTSSPGITRNLSGAPRTLLSPETGVR